MYPGPPAGPNRGHRGVSTISLAGESLLARASAHPCLHCLTNENGSGEESGGGRRPGRIDSGHPSRRGVAMLRRIRRALLTATATTAMTAGAVFGGAHVATALTSSSASAAVAAPQAGAPSAAPALVTEEQPVGPAYWLVGS